MTSVKSCGNTERICDRPNVDHGTEGHNSFGDNVGPDLMGVGGWGLKSGPGSQGRRTGPDLYRNETRRGVHQALRGFAEGWITDADPLDPRQFIHVTLGLDGEVGEPFSELITPRQVQPTSFQLQKVLF